MSSVCKYFLQGRCKFGNQCRYLHVRGNNTGFGNPAFPVSNSSAFSTQNRFSSLTPTPTSGNRSNMNTNEIIDTIGKEMQEWEKSHMWPFSCYAFMKDAPCLKGLDDYSPEELRFEAYNAKKSNKIAEFQTNFNQLVQSFQEKRQRLKQPTMQIRQTLTAEIDSFKQLHASKQGSAFGSSSSAFSSKPAFGSGGFGSTNRTFGSQEQASVFGHTSSSNPFQQKTGSAFTSSPAFGSKPASTFSSTTQSFTSSSFGTSSPTFGQGTGFGTSPMGNNSQTPFSSTNFGSTQANAPTFGSSSAFGQTTKSTGFGTASTPTFGSSSAFNTSFGQAKNQSVFGSTNTQSGSGFGPSTTNTTFISQSSTSNQNPFGGSTSSSSIFGGQSSGAASNPFGGVSSHSQSSTLSEPSLIEDGCYSSLDKLTPWQLDAFKSDQFDLDKIPTVPPPKELCT